MFGHFFYLHKSDRRVILALLAVAAAALTVIVVAGGNEEQAADGTAAVGPAADSLATPARPTPSRGEGAAASAGYPYAEPQAPAAYYRQAVRQAERFVFDPNTADSTALLRLGLQPWQVRNIYKFRASGGVYRKKEDFARLYGLTAGQYRELEPYISIGADFLPASTLMADDRPSTHKLAAGETLDLATADTAALQRIPGIGPYFARRIVAYGRQLGGYVSLSQLNEIEDFPQEALDYLTFSPTEVRRLNVNALSLNELKRHPYINFYQARAIVDYRRQQGPIEDLDDLRLLPDFPAEAIDRLRPYVSY